MVVADTGVIFNYLRGQEVPNLIRILEKSCEFSACHA